jgi:hypothetical protein
MMEHAHEMHSLLDVLRTALWVTGFVFAMMLVIEYVNVLTAGAWQRGLAGRRRGQYVLAGLLGAAPGCLGPFAVVAMYSHGVVSFGAVVTAMIATSGDEAYVMLALIPKEALVLFAVLFALGVVAGVGTDAVLRRRKARATEPDHVLEVHEEHLCAFRWPEVVSHWRECSAARGTLAIALTLYAVALAVGWVGHAHWDWMRVTLLGVSAGALFIVATVPDHFLEEHLWRHVALKHLPRLFLWTLGALLVMHLLITHLHLEHAIEQSRWTVLLIACLVGIIPESGPHLIFVTLYASGSIPLSVLLGGSIVQDGHGMLPLLADSRRDFIKIKAINFAIGLAVGAAALAAGL